MFCYRTCDETGKNSGAEGEVGVSLQPIAALRGAALGLAEDAYWSWDLGESNKSGEGV